MAPVERAKVYTKKSDRSSNKTEEMIALIHIDIQSKHWNPL